MFAKIIVDVPAKGTNRVFDYLIPITLASTVEVGSRVEVPFGGRVLQGYVVGLTMESSYEMSKLKPITRVLDVEPPLTEELVTLARWMSDKYLCHIASALNVMLPGALKGKAERYVVLQEKELHMQSNRALLNGADFYDGGQEPNTGREPGAGQGPDTGQETMQSIMSFPIQQAIKDFIRKKGKVTLVELLDAFKEDIGTVKQMFTSGVMREVQSVKDRLAVRKVLTIYPKIAAEQLRAAAEQLPANAHKQKEVLLFIADYDGPIRLAELTEQLPGSAGSARSLATKGLIEVREVESLRDPFAGREFPRTSPLTLTDEQQVVFEAIDESVSNTQHDVFLLHGVTGSGKTEVYLQTIQRCLDMGREAIVLVPEISLTPQMVERFKGRFGDAVAVLHSRLSLGERYDEWRKIKRGQVKVAIGARSAVFAPFERVGLIIIDEEHESSYKQEETPKYHARDVAIRRAELSNAVVVLGSATPSLETIHETNYEEHGTGRYKLLTMNNRASGGSLPEVHVVDMREELKQGNRSMFSKGLYKAIEERLHKKEQMILFLNRRGYATFVMCRTCGYVAQCPHCDISLTYHQKAHAMRCHYCGYAEREPKVCPSCDSEHIRHFGTGTQRVEEELYKLFTGIRVIRMDVDTTTTKGSHEKLLTAFRNKQGDVLLGTQMVAKGLDFPDVTLVGVIAADTVLGLPDFRAGERTFQLLTQVAGRAGRHVLPGEVFVQTYMPEHYAIQAASEHDYAAFALQELQTRKARGYPPYHKMMLITFTHEQVPQLVRTAGAFAVELRRRAAAMQEGDRLESNSLHFEVLGPVASPIPRIKDRYRFQCVVKYRVDTLASQLVIQTAELFEDRLSKEKIGFSVDVDPQYLM